MARDLDAVLAAVRAGDAASVPVLADLLEEAGDPRAAAVRALREEPHGWRVQVSHGHYGGTYTAEYLVWGQTPMGAALARDALVAALGRTGLPTADATEVRAGTRWDPQVCLRLCWGGREVYDGEGAPARLCARAAALFLPLRILDCAAGPGGVVLLDGKGGVLPRGAEPVYLECRPGEVARNSRGQPFDPQPHFPAEG